MNTTDELTTHLPADTYDITYFHCSSNDVWPETHRWEFLTEGYIT